jgi:hypothetical protein
MKCPPGVAPFIEPVITLLNKGVVFTLAIHIDPFHSILEHSPVNTLPTGELTYVVLFIELKLFQLIPSYEYITEYVEHICPLTNSSPSPEASQNVPLVTTLRQSFRKLEFPYGELVQLIPSYEYTIVGYTIVPLPPPPPATHIVPLVATVRYDPITPSPRIQLIPSYEYTGGPPPQTTHTDPFHVTEYPLLNIEFVFAQGAQLIPSYEYPNEFVPYPPATHIKPFHAMS